MFDLVALHTVRHLSVRMEIRVVLLFLRITSYYRVAPVSKHDQRSYIIKRSLVLIHMYV